MRKLLNPVLAAACLAAAAAPAAAREVTIAIDLSGLDLTDPADVEAVRDRIDLQVSKACSDTSILFDGGAAAVAECKADATAKALEKVNSMRKAASLAMVSDSNA